MSFMEGILKRNVSVWDKCIDTMFVQDMKDGKLTTEDFKEYIVQDSIYLKNYARVYGKAIYHAETLREIQLYYSILNFVTDTESVVRLNYLRQFGMTDDDIEFIDPLPENHNYIDFLFETAERGNGCEILMAVLPCMLSYSYIFRKLADEPESRKSRYWDFIHDYADDQYAWFLIRQWHCHYGNDQWQPLFWENPMRVCIRIFLFRKSGGSNPVRLEI